ncbi:MAG: aldo/keto reductase [Candidatus Hodarchaeales archaeon]|jgi:diketogulonate reductase-like aldo/keto reductase
MDINSRVKLNNGVSIPYLGLGVYTLKPSVAVPTINWAINLGYRLIDTASLYGNEREVGEAIIAASDIPRKEFYVTTKLWNKDHGFEKALAAFDHSLKIMGLDYIDLYLIHWPIPKRRLESWKALESLLETGKVKSIGVSNYMIPHLEELLNQCNITPVINQIEYHPWLYRKELQEYCRSKNIRVQAYSPLTKGRKLNDPILLSIAAKYSKSPAQILIRWCLEHDTSTIPMSSSQDHLKENTEVFDFSLLKEDMSTLDQLDQGYVVSWDPRDYP